MLPYHDGTGTGLPRSHGDLFLPGLHLLAVGTCGGRASPCMGLDMNLDRDDQPPTNE